MLPCPFGVINKRWYLFAFVFYSIVVTLFSMENMKPTVILERNIPSVVCEGNLTSWRTKKNLRNFFETMEIMEMPFSAFIFYWQTIPGIFYHGNLVFFLALVAPSPWWFVIHFLSFFRCLHTQFGIFTSKPIWPLMQFIRFHLKKHLKCQCDLASPTDGHWRIQIELKMPLFRISESAFITIQQIE